MIDRTSPLFLMANLGSEVSRAFSFKEKNEQKFFEESVSRCKNILDKVMSLSEMKNRKSELSNLQNILSNPDLFLENKKSLQSYFDPFALRLMNRLAIS